MTVTLRRLALAITVLALAVPAEASAAHTLYAAPEAHGVHDCSSPDNACILGQALEATDGPGDTVLVTGSEGVYDSFGGQITENDPNVTVRGINGRPSLVFSGDGLWMHGGGTTHVSNLSIENSSFGQALSMYAGSVDNVIVKAGGNGGSGCSLLGATITNSVCSTSGGPGAAALRVLASTADSTVTLRNVTAYAPSTNAIGVQAEGDSGKRR